MRQEVATARDLALRMLAIKLSVFPCRRLAYCDNSLAVVRT